MLARKLMVLACFLCAGSAFAVELDQPVNEAATEESFGIVSDKIVATPTPATDTETVAGGGEEALPSGEENKDG